MIPTALADHECMNIKHWNTRLLHNLLRRFVVLLNVRFAHHHAWPKRNTGSGRCSDEELPC